MKKKQAKKDEGKWMTIEEWKKKIEDEIDTDFAKRGWSDPNKLTVIVVRK